MEPLPILRAMLKNKPRFGLIAMQIATTLAIVVNCVVLIVDARVKLGRSSGLDDEHLVKLKVRSPLPNARPDAEQKAWFQRIQEDLRRIPGIESLSASSFQPWSCAFRDLFRPANTKMEKIPVGACCADESLPETIGLTIEEGRWYSHDEVQATSRNTIIITRTIGRRLFGDEPLLGKLIENFNGNVRTVIGVVQDPQSADKTWHTVHHEDPRCAAFHACPAWDHYVTRVESGETHEVLMRINQYLEAQKASSQSTVETFATIRDRHFGQQRTIVTIMGLLMFLLLVIASLGIGGLTSFSVTERTRQIGIRRALGATTNDILRYFLTESGFVTTLGLVVGTGLAVLLNMAVLRIYDGAKLSAPIVAGCALLLWFVALGAALPPAIRASRISPAIATRNV